MQLLPPEIRSQLPPLDSQVTQGDEAIAYVKFFTPASNWTWYAIEFDGQDTFFGLVQGFEEELGYFSLSELLECRGPMQLPIERDEAFQPTPLAQLRWQRPTGTGGPDWISYQFTDADRADPTQFFEFMTHILGTD